MSTLYFVDYGQGFGYDGDEPFEDVVTLGVFSTREKAQETIDRLKNDPLFQKYPDRFQILTGQMNEGGWETGFVSFGEALDALDEADKTS